MNAPRYAILQTTLDVPPVEALKQAFRSVKCLTRYDAHILANDAYGILVKNLSGDDALAIKNALSASGVQTELVPEAQVPSMPASKTLRRADCTPDGLLVYDPLGRTFPVEWQHLSVIAAGSVRLTEFKTIEKTHYEYRADARGHPYPIPVTDRSTREERNFRLVLELIMGRGVARYSIEAEKFNFNYLEERRTGDTEPDFQLLVRDLIRFAPQSAINRGAYYIRENAREPFPYPTKNAFFEEIIWLLWQMKRADA